MKKSFNSECDFSAISRGWQTSIKIIWNEIYKSSQSFL